jgi:hypothetical protein
LKRFVVVFVVTIVLTLSMSSLGVALAKDNTTESTINQDSTAQAAGDVSTEEAGYQDFDYRPTKGTAVNSRDGDSGPTGEKPQSKLWFNDGIWWGIFFDRSTEEYHIYRYDWATHTWSDTGTLIDRRNSSRADAKWDGTHLYVASAPYSTSSPDLNAYVKRYSYDPATKTYTRDITATVANEPLEAIVLDKDATGKLWVTYTQNSQVYVNHSLDSDSSWGTPFVLPVEGTSVSADDISAVIAFDSQIGVMWSNQLDDAMYFATHNDGDPDDVWQPSRTAVQGPKSAEDHINLKALQADSSGRVFAAIKTGLDDLRNPNPNAPLIFLSERDEAGNWTNNVFGRVADNHTRPMLMIDEEHRNLYVFATAPCCSGGAIYYKQTSLDNISFSEGVGTPFIQSTTDTHINNPTSTKQNVNGTTGLLVEASDTTSNYYWHNRLDLSDPPTDPPTSTAPAVTSTTPKAVVSKVKRNTNITATFSEDMDPSTINNSTFKLYRWDKKKSTWVQVSSTATTVKYDSSSKTATLDPYGSSRTLLAAKKKYKAVVTTDAKGTAGNPLDQDPSTPDDQIMEWTFTTGRR